MNNQINISSKAEIINLKKKKLGPKNYDKIIKI